MQSNSLLLLLLVNNESSAYLLTILLNDVAAWIVNFLQMGRRLVELAFSCRIGHIPSQTLKLLLLRSTLLQVHQRSCKIIPALLLLLSRVYSSHMWSCISEAFAAADHSICIENCALRLVEVLPITYVSCVVLKVGFAPVRYACPCSTCRAWFLG